MKDVETIITQHLMADVWPVIAIQLVCDKQYFDILSNLTFCSLFRIKAQ